MPRAPTLRQRLKQETRKQIEGAALELLAKQGYQKTSIDQIVRRAGTTRTTYYDHFKCKSDLITLIQEREIGPAVMALCDRLDRHDPIRQGDLRAWLVDYARTWRRIRVFFDAYSDASRTDAAVAATILPNSYAVTARMERFLGRFQGAARDVAHDKLVLLFNDLDQLMHVTSLMHDRKASERMFDAFTDLYWRGLFEAASRVRKAGPWRVSR